MMECKEIMRRLEGLIPPACASDWDNVGLLVGDPKKKVDKILVALDASDQVLDQAEAVGADMLLTHHPLIFSPVKNVREDDFIGWRIRRMIRMDLSYYAMHTNYDILGMADLSAGYLELSDTKVLCATGEKDGEPIGFGRVGNLPCEMTLKEYALLVKKNLKLSDVKVYGNLEQTVKTAAVCTGSGKSMIQDVLAAGADVYVTGDIDHHTGIDTVAQGLAIIDAGHYGTEYIFMEDMKERLAKAFPELTVSCAKVRSPYTIL